MARPPNTQHRAESQLLQLASSPRFDDSHCQSVERLLQASVNWTDTLEAAQAQAVLPLLTRNLGRLAPGVVPAAVLRHLNLRHAVLKRKNAMLVAELARLVERFATAGIDIIAYKGPVVGELCYGDANLRSFGDLDFLVRREHLRDVRRMLSEDGYQLNQPLSRTMHILFEEVAKEYCFARGPIVLEPHWSITMPRFPFPLDYDGLWERTHLWRSSTATLRIFAPEDLLLITCVIGAKAEWKRLQMIGDIAAVLLTFPALNAGACLELARETGTRRILLLGCYLAQALYAVPLPEPYRRPLGDDRVVPKLAQPIATRLLQVPPHPNPPQGTQYSRLLTAMRERPSDKARYIWRSITTPTVEHMYRMPLPAAFHGMYRILVPLYDHLLKPIGKKLFRRA